MSYVARNDVPLKAAILHNLERPEFSDGFLPSAVFELDMGALVAVYFAAKRTPSNKLSCRIAAWMVDAEGDAQQSTDEFGFPTGQPIVTEFKHHASPTELERYGVAGLAAALRDLVLGEPAADPPVVRWSDLLREEVSVRNAIVSALAMGETVDLTVIETPAAVPVIQGPQPLSEIEQNAEAAALLTTG